MHGLQACSFKYVTVAAVHIYALRGEDEAKIGGWRPCILNSHGDYLVVHGKSWNCVLKSCGNPEGTGPFLYQKLNKSKIHSLIDTNIPSIKCKNMGFQGSEEPNEETIETIQDRTSK